MLPLRNPEMIHCLAVSQIAIEKSGAILCPNPSNVTISVPFPLLSNLSSNVHLVIVYFLDQ